MIIRRLTAFLLALSVVGLIVALCLQDWSCGNLFTQCTEQGAVDRDAMLAVTTMLTLGVALIFIVFIFDVVLLTKKDTPDGLVTARFVLIYLGAAMVFIAVIVYTAVKSSTWGYFFAVFSSTIALVIAMMAVASSKCVSRTEATQIQSN